jgi:hypothetical protein
MYCTKCGTRNDDTAKFCIKCGAQLQTPPAAPPIHKAASPPAGKPGRSIGWKMIAIAGILTIVLVVLFAGAKALHQKLVPTAAHSGDDTEAAITPSQPTPTVPLTPAIPEPDFSFMWDYNKMSPSSNRFAVLVMVAWNGELIYSQTQQGNVFESGQDLYPYVWNAWGFRGNAGDVISIGVNSQELCPLIELFDSTPTDTDVLLRSGQGGQGYRALIDRYALPYSGVYYILVGGIGGQCATGQYEMTLWQEAQ